MNFVFTEITRLFGLLVVLNFIGCHSRQLENFENIQGCLADLNKEIQIHLNKVNPLLCRFPSKTRKKLKFPQLSGIINSVGNNADGSTFNEMFTSGCDGIATGELDREDVYDLMNFLDFARDHADNFGEYLDCVNKIEGETNNRAVLILGAYKNFYRQIEETLRAVLDHGSGGASCTTNAECGEGECDNDICVCDVTHTGKRCHIVIDNTVELSPCASVPCKNGGRCRMKEGEIECKCEEGFRGERCQTAITWEDCKDDFSYTTAPVHRLIQELICLERYPIVENLLKNYQQSPLMEKDNQYICPSDTLTSDQAGEGAKEIIEDITKKLSDEVKEEAEQLRACAARLMKDEEAETLTRPLHSLTILFYELVDEVNPDFHREQCMTPFKSMIKTLKDYATQVICKLNLLDEYRALIDELGLRNLLEASTELECDKHKMRDETTIEEVIDIIQDAKRFLTRAMANGYLQLEACLEGVSENDEFVTMAHQFMENAGPVIENLFETLIPGPCVSTPCKNDATCINVGNMYWCQCKDGNTGRNCELDKYVAELEECKKDFEERLKEGNTMAVKFVCAAKDVDDLSDILDTLSLRVIVEGVDCTEQDLPTDDVRDFLRQILARAKVFVEQVLPEAYETMLMCATDVMGPAGVQNGKVNAFRNEMEHIKVVLEKLSGALDRGPCSSSPCQKSGTCLNVGNSYHCVCPAYFAGDLCQIDVCPSTRNKCGLCVGGLTGLDETQGINKCGGCSNNPDHPQPDCNNDCGGTAVMHSFCRKCYGGNTGISLSDVYDCRRCVMKGQSNRDCAGNCLQTDKGGAFLNKCDVCVGGETGVQTRSGMDVCGVCGGDGTTCDDCTGEPNGMTQVDDCGVCGGTNECVKVLSCDPRGVLVGSETNVVITGVGLTGGSPRVVAQKGPKDVGVSLDVIETVVPKTLTVMVPATLTPGSYIVRYSSSASAPLAESEAQLEVINPDDVRLLDVSPASIMLERYGSTEITITGEGLPPVQLMCLYRDPLAETFLISMATGTGNERKCGINHPRRSCDLSVSLSMDGTTPLGGSVNIQFTSPAPVCKLGFNSLGDEICLKCDVPLSMEHLDSALDIFEDPSPLGDSVNSEIPELPSKTICFNMVDLRAAGRSVTLKPNAIRAAGTYTAAASGSLTVEAIDNPPRPDATMAGQLLVGSCSDVTLHHAYPSEGRRGQDLTYTQSVEPSEGVTIVGEGTPDIRLVGLTGGRDYTVRQTVCNQAEDCSTDVKVVSKKTTPAPEVTIPVDVNPKHVRRSSRITLTANIQLPTCLLETTAPTSTWSVSRSDVILTNTDKSEYIVKPFTLPLGATTFSVTVASQTNPDISTTRFITLHVVSSPLEVTIQGSSTRTVGVDSQALLLEGAARDPDVAETDQGQMTTTWECIPADVAGKACRELTAPVERDRVAVTPGLYAAGDRFRFLYTASSGFGENRRITRQSVVIDFVEGNLCNVELRTEKTYYSPTEVILITARCKTSEAVTFDWSSFDGEKESSEMEDGDTSVAYDYIEINNETAVVGKASLSEKQEFYQSRLQIKKGVLNSGSTYKFVARVIYPNKAITQAAIEIEVSQEIKNCFLQVNDYVAFDKIFLETVKCEGDNLRYEYSAEEDGSTAFLGTGRSLTVIGPSPVSGTSLNFMVKVTDGVTGQFKTYTKTVQVLPPADTDIALANLEEDINSKLQEGNKDEAATVAALILKGFGESVGSKTRKRREANIDLVILILDAAEGIVSSGFEGSDHGGILQALTNLHALTYEELTNDQKIRLLTDLASLFEMLTQGDNAVPEGFPKKVDMLLGMARTEGVDKALIGRLDIAVVTGMMSGLMLGDETVTHYGDRVKKVINTPLADSAISGSDGNCDAKILSGDSLNTRFEGSIILSMVTYASDVDYLSSGELRDLRTSNILSIDVYDKLSRERISVAGLSQDVIICLPVSKTIEGKGPRAKYFDPITKEWLSDGISMSDVPDVCRQESCDMVAIKTSHFTDVTTFATDDVNECFPTSPCDVLEYCRHWPSSIDSPNAMQSCHCVPWLDAGLGCIADYGSCMAGDCEQSAACAVDGASCVCPSGFGGKICQHSVGTFAVDLEELSVDEGDGTVDFKIVRTGGHDGIVDVTILIPPVAAQAQKNQDYADPSGTKTFLHGETSKTFQISITQDDYNEVDEYFVVDIAVSDPAALGASRTTITIVDDDEAIDQCIAIPPPTCAANERCLETDHNYQCVCLPGFTGSPCEFDDTIDRCNPNPCVYGNCFVIPPQTTSCVCDEGYEGDYCEYEIDECTAGTATCPTDSTCANTLGSYECPCDSGFVTNVAITECLDLNECVYEMHNCLDPTYCVNNDGSFSCQCPPGFEGDAIIECNDINECLTQCLANGVCTNSVGSFTCDCDTGYEIVGTECTNIDECTDEAPCGDNADCADNDGSYTCSCSDGYSGDGFTCSDINECLTQCLTNGVCTDSEGSFTCDCDTGYEIVGTECTNIDECVTEDYTCDPNAGCSDNDGSYDCICNTGWSGDGLTCTDIDECVTGDHSCDPNAGCSDNDGSYDCACNPGWSGDGLTCTDIDECVTGDHSCDPNAGCSDNDGSYDCACNPGWSGDGLTCTDIDECVTGDHSCDPNAGCSDNDGSYDCTCDPGWSGDGLTCTDIDECVTGDYTCDPNAACSDNDGSYDCTCDPGWSGDGLTCTDIDECVTGDHSCDPNAGCSDNDGSYDCTCDPGWSGDGLTCTDIDECVTGDYTCDPNAACSDNDGSYDCTCDPGWSGDGLTCTDIDECVTGDHSCDPNAGCSDNDGSYDCTCDRGWSGDGLTCTDIDECVTGDYTCDPNAACSDNDGSYDCTCDPGWSGDGLTCTDIDECVTGDHSCDPNAGCSDNDGSYDCACNTGWSGDGLTCTDIDECVTGDYTCDPNAACSDNDGSYDCTCDPGWSGDGLTCTDIDECVTGDHSCDPNAGCSDNDGSYDCTCDPGWSGDGLTCTDIDECVTGDYTCDSNAACSDNDGSYDCTCDPGWSGDGLTCTDIDECVTGDHTCDPNAGCSDNDGSYDCACNTGWSGDGLTCTDIDDCREGGPSDCGPNSVCTDEGANSWSCACSLGYNGDGIICLDIDECGDPSTMLCHSESSCINTPGSHICQCNDGYSGDGYICEDIDECTDETDNCDSNALCENEAGSFTCTCNGGFSGGGITCTDLNECGSADDNSCDTNGFCINDPGSYDCACNEGYSGDGFSCSDIDECTDETDNCDSNALCENEAGDFTCTCNEGFSGSGITCTDLNECGSADDNSCDTNGFCINEPGSYDCACNDGYSGDGFSCSDIDECTDETDNCDSNALCENEAGSFTCTCNEGFIGGGITCTDVIECDSDHDCHADATCTNTHGSYICMCKDGYSGDGLTCSDIDECTDKTDNCDNNAVCENAAGGFTCTCNEGFTGGGITCTDIDECTGDNSCSENAGCSNIEGSYDCACNEGYTGNGFSCSVFCGGEFVGEETGVITSPFYPGDYTNYLTCVWKIVAPEDSTVVLQFQAFEVEDDSVCEYDALDVWDGDDDSSPHIGKYCGTIIPDDIHSTSNSLYLIFTTDSSDLEPGFSLTFITDIDECSAKTDNCDTNADCENEAGSFTCTCKEGFTGSGVTCTDLNECGSPDDNSCDTNGFCINDPGSYDCACNDGYSGDGFSCSDIDECTDATDNCDSNALCENEAGSFTCTCNEGFTGGGITCTDLDECGSADDNSCDTNGFCINDPGSYDCACNDGYSGDGFSCADIDECTDETDNCDSNALCENEAGSFTCTCNEGFTGGGITCTDLNECGSADDNSCDTNGFCINDPGSYDCACNDGYSGDGFSCSDIDECTDETDNCDSNALCENEAGDFTCTCNEGFTGNGIICTDVIECDSDHDCHADATCTNTHGSYICMCKDGYSGDGLICSDIDECTDETDNCDSNTLCENEAGSFTCTCNEGYSGDGVTCTDIDECTTGAHNCNNNAVCTNNPGSWECHCKIGYSGNGVTCTDINECADKTDNCADNAECENEDGSFTCTCNQGYSGDGVTCTDIDECTTGAHNCDNNAVCTNNPGSWECHCKIGYSGNGVTCTDINECVQGTDNCNENAECGNTDGSFTCTCNPGYAGDGVVCNNINECLLEIDTCSPNGLCTDTIGSFTCACKVGYRGDGFTCTDINECVETENNNCHISATCTNTQGSFTCTCNQNYTGDGVRCIQCIYDCNGVCYGSAVLDCSNTCAEGNTGVIPKVSDRCGVCEGDGTSCVAITGLSPAYIEERASLEMILNGENLENENTQCVALATGSTIEHRLNIVERTSASSLKVSIEAGTFEVGTYMLKCRMGPTARLGNQGGTFYVYQSSVSDITPSAYISGPDMIDMCSDLELNGVSSSGSGTLGLTYSWAISPDSGITSDVPHEGHIIYRGLVAGTTYTVSLRVCTVFDSCNTATHTVTKSSTRIPTVTIRTTVDLTAAPANTNFELIGDAYSSTCTVVLTSQKLTYQWTLTGPDSLVVNSETTSTRAYQVRVGDFPGGATIMVTLRVALLSDPTVYADKTITIVTASRPLVVVVDGGAERTLKVGSGVQIFDGSGTMDPDSSSAVISYSWTSLQYNSDGLSDGPCIPSGTVTDQAQLSIDVSAITVGYRCDFTLSATSSTGKSGSAMSTLFLEAGSSAACFLSNKKMYYVPRAGAMLELTCTSSSGVQDVQWTSTASEGVQSLDLAEAAVESYVDSLGGNEFKAYLVIAEGFLMAGKLYNIEAQVTDQNGALAKSRTNLQVMDDITGGEMNCPASYVELDQLTVTVRKVAAPATFSMTYCLMVQTGSTAREAMALSEKQGTGDFEVTGPKQQGSSGNIFIAEVCIEGGDLCKQFSCTVPTVVPPIDIELLSRVRNADIAKHRNEGRPLEAAILLAELYDKTGDAELVPLFLEIATELTEKRSMNENSASVLLEVIQSIPPEKFSSAQFSTVAALLNKAGDYFHGDTSKLSDRSLMALNKWVANAKGANVVGSVIEGVKEKIKKMQIAGLDYGSTRTLDLQESKVTVLNSAPGNSLVVKDGSDRDVVFKFGQSLREMIGNKNVIIRVEAYKATPDSITDTTTDLVSDIANIEFFDSNSNEAIPIKDLTSPSEFNMPVPAASENDFRLLKCKFWDITGKMWSSAGVQTSVISSTVVQCKSNHFTSYAVVNENPVSGSGSNLGWIIGVVCGVILLMVLIIIIVVLLVFRYQRNTVFDISRSSSRTKVAPESGRQTRPNTAYIRRSPELDDENNQNNHPHSPQGDPRPGSGGSTDGLTRHMHM